MNTFGYGTANPEGARFAEKVLTHMRERLVEFQEEKGTSTTLRQRPLRNKLQARKG